MKLVCSMFQPCIFISNKACSANITITFPEQSNYIKAAIHISASVICQLFLAIPIIKVDVCLPESKEILKKF